MGPGLPAGDGLGVAVIGCGYWGVNYVRVLGELTSVDTVTAFDSSPDKLEAVARRFPLVRTTDSLADVLDSSDCQAVIVSTPATTHFELARRCLEAGKHLLVEKPITTDSEQARRLIDLAMEAGVTMAVGHTFLHNPSVQMLKRYVEAGSIGDLYYLYARRTNLGPIRSDVNALWDLAPHDISIFNHLLGDTPRWVSAVGSSVIDNNRHDVGFVSIGYASGVVAHLHVSWADPFKVRELVVVGSQQRVVFDDLNTSEPVRVYEKGVAPAAEENPTFFGEHALLIRDGDIVSPKIEVSEPLKNQVVDFLDSVVTGRPPVADGEIGLAVVEVMEAIDRSIELDGTPVPVGLSTTAPKPGGEL
jgi:predicted dehydrogenase